MKDPNAMDVDALSVKQQEEAMRKGACFGCGEIGHISLVTAQRNNKTVMEVEEVMPDSRDSLALLETVERKAKIFSLTSTLSLQDYQLMSSKNS